MGQVVPFIARVRDSGDWTAGERARLEALGDQLGAAGVDVDVIFGATDEGDPWCVVTDANGDVLIHVARIGGVFVVHSAVDDAMSEGMDLHAALRERLAATEEAFVPKTATILNFDLSARQGQTLLALVVAAAFFYETAAPGEAHAAELPPPAAPVEDPPPAAPADTDAVTQERETTTRGAAEKDNDAPGSGTTVAEPETPAPAAAPAEPEAPPPAPPETAAPAAPMLTAVALAASPEPAAAAPAVIEIRGTDADDHLVGTAANEHILGGAGNDTLEGGGGHDTLDGGAGNDCIVLDAGVVAIGGAGADTFVLHRPLGLAEGKAPPPEGVFFGTVLDLNFGQGDRVVNSQGVTVRLTPHPDGTTPATGSWAPPTPDGARQGGGDPGQTGLGQTGLAQTGPAGDSHFTFTTTVTPQPPLTRVDVDLDGDGVNDGYLLVGHHGGAPLPPPTDHPEDPPITAAVGHAFGGGEVLG